MGEACLRAREGNRPETIDCDIMQRCESARATQCKTMPRPRSLCVAASPGLRSVCVAGRPGAAEIVGSLALNRARLPARPKRIPGLGPFPKTSQGRGIGIKRESQPRTDSHAPERFFLRNVRATVAAGKCRGAAWMCRGGRNWATATNKMCICPGARGFSVPGAPNPHRGWGGREGTSQQHMFGMPTHPVFFF